MSASSINIDLAKRLDITCRKGDTFNLTINVTDAAGDPVDMSTYTFKMEIRETDTSVDSVVTDDQITIIGYSIGQIRIKINADIMDDVDSGLYAYDLQTTIGGTTQTWLTGIIKVNEDVTV